MFKKFITDTKNNIKNDFKVLLEETKEEIGIRNKKELFEEIDKSKNSLKKGLKEEHLSGNDMADITDAVLFSNIGGVGLSNEFGKTKLFTNSADGLNTIINKVQNAIPEKSLFEDLQNDNVNTQKVTTIQTNVYEDNMLKVDPIIAEVKKTKTNMISDNLNSLIEFALADGELTEKEKQILFKKADSEGIDLDEFEMILEAKLFQTKQIQSPSKPIENINVAPKSDKFGDIKKCPSCGAIVESFTTNCSDCGNDFKGINANNTIERLFSTLDSIESSRKTGVGSFLSATFGATLSMPDTDRRKIEAISNFPVPNTKEDFLEFLMLSISKIKFQQTSKFSGKVKFQNTPFNTGILSSYVGDTLPNTYAQVWLNKCAEIINKARISMKDDKKTLQEIEYHAQQLGIK